MEAGLDAATLERLVRVLERAGFRFQPQDASPGIAAPAAPAPPVAARRYPIAVGDWVRHIDHRTGIVVALAPCRGLPGAVVDFDSGARKLLPLGYLERVGSWGTE